MSIGKYTRGRFRHGSVLWPGWPKSDPLSGDTQNDKHEKRLSAPCAIRWVNSLMQTVLQIMLWTGMEKFVPNFTGNILYQEVVLSQPARSSPLCIYFLMG